MSTVGHTFAQSAADVRCLQFQPTEEELLTLYGLYKQAKYGDVYQLPPSLADVSERAKWNAWKVLEGTLPTQAAHSYINHVDFLIQKYGLRLQASL